MSLQHVPIKFRFGLFEFNPASGELHREGSPVRLQPQPARVLALLVERAGELVTRDELQQHIWGDATFVDFDRGLNFSIAQIRTALGDSAESPRFVETVPRRGYRFIAPVDRRPAGQSSGTFIGDSHPGHSSGTGPGDTLRRKRSRRIHLSLAGLFFMLVGAVLYQTVRSGTVRVGVIPFDNETGSAEYDVLATAVADALVARLSADEHRARLTIVGNAAELRQARARRDLTVLGDELGLTYVILGQVQRDPRQKEHVRVIAHLIRVGDQGHVWARTFDRDHFTLAVQSEIVETIARAVAARLPET